MREILDFLKEIFMIEKETRLNIGLTQFKEHKIEEPVKKVSKRRKEPTLSELMRGTVN